jgi:transcriptional regulator with XRE-family HTH domain
MVFICAGWAKGDSGIFVREFSFAHFQGFFDEQRLAPAMLGGVAYMTTGLPLRHQGKDEIRKQLASFGARLKELRLRHGWTLQELAARSSLSKPFLSRLESGGRQASIAAALTLSRIFGVSLASLFESSETETPCTIVRTADAREKTVNGLKYTLLSSGRFFNLQPLRVKISPSRRGQEHYQHEGEEWIYVLSGKLTLSLAGKTYDLEPGDAVHFESRLPHRLIARGECDVEVLVVAAPVWTPPMNFNFQQHRAIPVMSLLPMPKEKPIRGVTAARRLTPGGVGRRSHPQNPRQK